MTSTVYIQLFGGLIWLLMGGDLLVRGAVGLARRLRVSPMVVALTVVAFGTSLPELVVVLQAALSGHPGFVIGNVVGSNIANVLLVAGSAGIIYPLACGEGSLRRDSVVMIGVSVVFILLCLAGELRPIGGVALLGILLVVAGFTTREAARAYREADLATPMEWVLGLPSQIWTILVFIVVGAIGLPLGAKLVIDASTDIAVELGVGETIIGLTILAVSTSLPELATTVVAAARKRTEVAVGTVVGSNIFNILAIMGVAAAVSPAPIPVPPGFLFLDFPVMLGTAVILSAFIWLRRPIGRAAGVVFVIGYAAYVLALVIGPGSAVY